MGDSIRYHCKCSDSLLCAMPALNTKLFERQVPTLLTLDSNIYLSKVILENVLHKKQSPVPMPILVTRSVIVKVWTGACVILCYNSLVHSFNKCDIKILAYWSTESKQEGRPYSSKTPKWVKCLKLLVGTEELGSSWSSRWKEN